MATILVIDDNDTMREGIAQILSREGYTILQAANGADGIRCFRENDIDFVISDVKMDNMDGLQLLDKIKKISPTTLFLLITGFGSIETAVDAMKRGAFDFITKPFPPDLLREKTKQALTISRLQEENQNLKQGAPAHSATMIGASKTFLALKRTIDKVAASDTTILISGESGTGKDLVARNIHLRSTRANNPFVKVDCASLSQGILESELFGHEKGAFTGADKRRLGRFEISHGGTIFLDEIGEIPNAVQLRLLRVLQDRCFERVGGSKLIQCDVRVIAASNKNLAEEVRKGRFREDLFYRLNIIEIEVPALRERKEDIELLAKHFISHEKSTRISDDAMSLLLSYHWPGNIRQLRNAMLRALVLGKDGSIDADDLPKEIGQQSPTQTQDHQTLSEAVDALEKGMIIKALASSNNVKTKAAKILGLKTSALYYKLEKYGL